ncbi:MAG: aspartate aminotransferase family protein [Alcaligenaceae bacterium]|nr:aspartate aminotransferase family protein [Alcaligenaceae bacterium]
MSKIIHRSLLNTPRRAAGGQGAYIYDDRGKAYLDGSCGAAVSIIGHSHPKVLAAMQKQMNTMAYAHTSNFTTEVAEQLADFLSVRAPGDLDYCYFVSGGSEAVESALKMARQYFVEIGKPEKKYFIAREQSYHGNTLGALAVGGNKWRKKQFEALLMEVGRVSPCYEYRGRQDDESQSQYTQRLLQELEDKILELGADNVIAFVAEPVVGATAGAVPPTPGYFKGVREICTRHGILLIADEVMCGIGRTGSFFAVEQEAIVPDLIAIAKGLGGGYQPIGAVIARRPIVDALRIGSGLFQHGHTYMAHAVACAAALAVQEVIVEECLIEQVQTLSPVLENLLKEQLGDLPYVGDIRGRGLFWGVELVEDRTNKKTFDPALKIHAQIKSAAMDLGLLIYPSGGTVDGQYGDHILIAPPYICNENELQRLVELLTAAVKQVVEPII